MFASIDGKKVFYEERGRGKCMLFVHGWGGTSQSLEKLADLASDSYRVVRVDLPGFGQSDNPEPYWGVKEYAQILTRFIQQLKLKDLIYVGHSFGGTLGIYISSTNPKLFQKLVLCAPSYKREPKPQQKPSRLREILKKTPLLRFMAYKVFFPDSDLLKYPHLESNFKKIVTQDITPALEKIQVPTLAIWGDLDADVPISHAYALKDAIKGTQLVIVAGARHGTPLTHPDVVWKAMEKFL